MHREIGVALPGAELRVGELSVPHAARVLLAERQRAERLGQERQPVHAQRDLARLRLEERPLDAHHVTQVEQLHHLVRLHAQRVELDVQLDPPAVVLEVGEGGLAVRPQGDEPPGEPMGGRIAVAEALERGARRRRALEAVGVRRHAAPHQLLQLLPPRHFHEARHYAALLPKRLRYASMNWSRSPSITRWTSFTLSSVRWSFTIDRKSTRLNSSHSQISYAVFCLKKKKNPTLTGLP